MTLLALLPQTTNLRVLVIGRVGVGVGVLDDGFWQVLYVAALSIPRRRW
jgi:hypothetical protein